MFNAADRYVTYGFVPAQVEIDLDEHACHALSTLIH
jgi:hypothetical protein